MFDASGLGSLIGLILVLIIVFSLGNYVWKKIR